MLDHRLPDEGTIGRGSPKGPKEDPYWKRRNSRSVNRLRGSWTTPRRYPRAGDDGVGSSEDKTVNLQSA